MNYLLFLMTMLLTGLTGRPLPEVSNIIIDKPGHTLYGLTAKGDTICEYQCALGRNYGQKQREGDCKTPEGEFTITSIENSSYWEGDASGSDYGPWFMRLGGNTEWNSIGIHGTNQPETVGTRASLGCIRLHNGDLQLLRRMVIPDCRVEILADTITTNKVFESEKPIGGKVIIKKRVKRLKPRHHFSVRKRKRSLSRRHRS